MSYISKNNPINHNIGNINEIIINNNISTSPNTNTFKQMTDNVNYKDENNYIEKSFLIDLLKCDFCNFNFDLSTHFPFLAKCGHTFCKKCLLNNSKEQDIKSSFFNCPIDNKQNNLNGDSFNNNYKLET